MHEVQGYPSLPVLRLLREWARVITIFANCQKGNKYLDTAIPSGYNGCVELIFQDKKLDRLETDPRFDGGHPPEVVKAFRRRMQQIRAAVDERDFCNQRSLRFEKLAGARRHQHSMRLNDQWRLILEFHGSSPNKSVAIICIEDYHKGR